MAQRQPTTPKANSITISEQQLRLILVTKLQDQSQTELAEIIGVHPSVISRAVRGEVITGKLLRYLGYKRSKARYYELIDKYLEDKVRH